AEEAASITGVDYLIAGTMWPTMSKPDTDRLLGVDGFSSVVRAATVPVLAIGGVTLDRVRDVALAGGAGIAAIGLFMNARDQPCRAAPLDAVVRDLRARFDTSGSAS